MSRLSTKFLAQLVFVGMLTLAGCQDEQDTSTANVATETKTIDQVADALVTVNGVPITQADLDYTIERTFNQTELLYANADLNQKVLQSLIAGEAMKQKMQQELEPASLQALAYKVKAYEQELFIQQYLARYAEPMPVTIAMVEEYYQKYPEQFGGKTVKQIQLLRSSSPLSDQQRQQLLAEQTSIRDIKDWQTQQAAIPAHLQLQHTTSAGQLDQRLNQIINTLKVGDTSSAHFIDGNVFFVRVTAEKKLPPKPLAEVSAEIRKMLLPQQLKKAVKKASEEIVTAAKVEYQ